MRSLAPVEFIASFRYADLKAIGVGSQGYVALVEGATVDMFRKALDVTTGKYVAIKKLKDPFESGRKVGLAMRELVLLHTLNHPNVSISVGPGST